MKTVKKYDIKPCGELQFSVSKASKNVSTVVPSLIMKVVNSEVLFMPEHSDMHKSKPIIQKWKIV